MVHLVEMEIDDEAWERLHKTAAYLGLGDDWVRVLRLGMTWHYKLIELHQNGYEIYVLDPTNTAKLEKLDPKFVGSDDE